MNVMKATEFAHFLDQYSLQLRELRAYEYANGLSEICQLFRDQSPKATVDSVLKSLSKLNLLTNGSEGSLAIALAALKIANLTLKDFGKSTLAKDIQSTIAAFDPFKNADLSDVVHHLEQLKLPKAKPTAKKQPIREELVTFYHDRLLSALTDEIDFRSVFDELKIGKKLSANELKRLAKLFRGQPAGSGPAALASIWARHQSLLDSNARTRASAGRSAA